ncbi:MAG: helix-turn-helix domain-containing protein, partial [Ktedonobacteraceae bacterium]
MKPNQRLRHERELRGWSQARVAEALGTNPATVSRWECGHAFPAPHFREKLCELFARNAEELGLLQEESASEYAYHDISLPIAINGSGHTLISAAPQLLLDPAMPSLPAEVARLSGRDALLYQLKQRLASGGGSALAALGGVPGVGKTALALSLAHDQDIRRYFRDGILWVG